MNKISGSKSRVMKRISLSTCVISVGTVHTVYGRSRYRFPKAEVQRQIQNFYSILPLLAARVTYLTWIKFIKLVLLYNILRNAVLIYILHLFSFWGYVLHCSGVHVFIVTQVWLIGIANCKVDKFVCLLNSDLPKEHAMSKERYKCKYPLDNL